MAKIYETKEDFERDKLTEQAGELRLKAARQDGTAGSALIGGMFSSMLYERKPETRGWLSYLSWGLLGVGVAQVVRSWMTGSKAHNLELERERMGPETVILPPGVGADDNSCGCKLKPYMQSVEPKTLIDQATKSDNVLSKA